MSKKNSAGFHALMKRITRTAEFNQAAAIEFLFAATTSFGRDSEQIRADERRRTDWKGFFLKDRSVSNLLQVTGQKHRR